MDIEQFLMTHQAYINNIVNKTMLQYWDSEWYVWRDGAFKNKIFYRGDSFAAAAKIFALPEDKLVRLF